jgi:Tat protein secretion system quality control protein TatD with DNase activity
VRCFPTFVVKRVGLFAATARPANFEALQLLLFASLGSPASHTMPNVDRGGGRESKGHERRVKRGLAAKANPFQKKDTGAVAAITESVTPQALTNERSASSLIDLGCNILSRQLAREQGRMLQRAQNDHVDGVVVFSTDFDRIQELIALVKANPGFMYGAYGVHPDNIKRANEKTFTGKMSELKAMALSPECVALFCGLDFGRDFASHYPQQKIVQDHLRLAAEVRLPVLITQVEASERLSELLREFNDEWAATCAAAARAAAATAKVPDAAMAGSGARESGGKGKGGKESKETKEAKEAKEAKETKSEPAPAPAPVAAPTQAPWIPRAGVLAFDGDEKALQCLLDAGAYICIDGLVCDETPEADRLRSIVAKIPLDRLLLMTNSPLRTPQNISDHYIKSSRNEPCNLPFLLPQLCDCYNEAGVLSHKMTTAELAHITYENSVKFLQFPSNDFAGSGETSGKKESAAGKASDGAASSIAAGATGAAHVRGVSGVSESKGGDYSVKEGEEEELTPQQMAAGVQYRCKLCRFPVFTDSDVMPHDRHGIKQSARSRANDGEEGEEDEWVPLGTTAQTCQTTICAHLRAGRRGNEAQKQFVISEKRAP